MQIVVNRHFASRFVLCLAGWDVNHLSSKSIQSNCIPQTPLRRIPVDVQTSQNFRKSCGAAANSARTSASATCSATESQRNRLIKFFHKHSMIEWGKTIGRNPASKKAWEDQVDAVSHSLVRGFGVRLPWCDGVANRERRQLLCGRIFKWKT